MVEVIQHERVCEFWVGSWDVPESLRLALRGKAGSLAYLVYLV